MKTVGAYEAKTHLPRLLDEVEQGEHIIITRHGVAVAELKPVHTASASERQEAIEQLKAFRSTKPADVTAIREMIEEGRR
ncbi:MAG TPA: type II toxin-antitoxin system prevent-host-death family antitoxin [Armatimonadota bacterium]|nr:type II toxin-antitoxin system prevent-host-death family antitoxin [Armatimonadota bacterium]